MDIVDIINQYGFATLAGGKRKSDYRGKGEKKDEFFHKLIKWFYIPLNKTLNSVAEPRVSISLIEII